MKSLQVALLICVSAGTVLAQSYPPTPPSNTTTNTPAGDPNYVPPTPYYPLQDANKHQAISVDSELLTWNDFLEYRKPALALTAGVLNMKAAIEASLASSAVSAGYLDTGSFTTNGANTALIGIRNNEPIYYQTYNIDAADTCNTDELWVNGISGLDLSGVNSSLGMWDGNEVLESHQEFDGRAVQQDTGEDNAAYDSHPTAVAGTMIAQGQTLQAKGMAYEANLRAYGWNNDMAEMALAASSQDSLKISNHSYGRVCGWVIRQVGSLNYFFWYGNLTVSESEDYKFGFYSPDTARVIDDIAYSSPGYLSVWAAGNEGWGENQGPEFYGLTQPFPHYVLNGSAFEWRTDLSHEADGGIDGYDNISPQGSAKNNLTVGAIHNNTDGFASGETITLASFSSIGPTDDGRVKPDIVAPGVNLYTAGNSSNNDYITESGTSFSSPVTAGTLDLLQQLNNELFGTNRVTLSSTLKGIVIHTADDAGNVGPDYKFGWGALNALSAATLITDDADSGMRTHIKEFFIPDGKRIEFPVRATNSTPLKVTICWIDPPGPTLTPSLNPTNLTLVNDLDLRLISPSGVTNFPWVLDPSNPATPATFGDNYRDNVEQVYIESPESGLYSVEVSYKENLVNGHQTLSMLLSGNTPVDPGAFFIEQLEVASTTNTLQWGAIPGAFYQVQSCSDLATGNWTDTIAEISALGTNVVVDVSTNETRNAVFYRISESF